MLVALSSTTPASTSIVSFLNELDINLPTERTGTIVDHFNYDTKSAAEAHDVLVLDTPSNVRSGLKNYFQLPGTVLSFPRAVGHTLGSGPLLTPLVRAPATAYSYNPKEQGDVIDADELFAAGKQLSIVSAVQARNNARVAVLGSAEMLQDAWLDAQVSKVGEKKATGVENREFVRRLSGWAFQEIGVVRVNEIEHRLLETNEVNPSIYRIKTDAVSFIFPRLNLHVDR